MKQWSRYRFNITYCL